MILLLVAVVVVGALMWSWSRAGPGPSEGVESTLVGRAKTAATEAFAGANVKTLVQQGMALAGPKGRAAEVEEEEQWEEIDAEEEEEEEGGKEAEPEPLPQAKEERQASGRHVLQTGVDVALQELMETRGFADESRVRLRWRGWIEVG